MALTLDISRIARARRRIATSRYVALIFMGIETITLIGIPFVALQLFITGLTEQSLLRICRQAWRAYAFVASILVFFVLGALVLPEPMLTVTFAMWAIIFAYPTLKVIRAFRLIAHELRRATDTTFLKKWLFAVASYRPKGGVRSKGLPRATLWFSIAGFAGLLGLLFVVLQETGSVEFAVSGPVILCLLVGSYVVRRGRRHIQLGTAQKQAIDPRSPVLVLRSFKHDELRFERGLSGLLLPFHTSFEQVLTSESEALGPSIAIGEPGEKLPPLGAARAYLQNEDWQTTVRQLMDEAALLVIVLGATEGLDWEFRTAIESVNKQDSLIVMVPPLKRSALEFTWRRFATAHTDLIGRDFPREAPKEKVLAFTFRNRVPIMITGAGRRVWDYRLALRLGIEMHQEGLARHQDVVQFLAIHAPAIETTTLGARHG